MKIILFKDIIMPKKAHLDDSGIDVFIPETFELLPFETKVIGLGFGIEVPEGYTGMFVPRSSAAKRGLIIQTSLIDRGYTGEVHLIITNCSQNIIKIEQGQRVSSLLIYPILNPSFEIVTELEQTERSSNGLGSSGK